MSAVDRPPLAAALPMRGTVEGFYGPLWSHDERLAHLEFSARIGLNTYVYAPKHDPYHRTRWRDRYPADDLERLAALAAAARMRGIRFTYGISPGLSMRFAEDPEHRVLAAKAGQLYDVGIASFALFFDDLPTELTRADERDRWPGTGAAHGETCARFVAGFLEPHGIREPLLVCPSDYAGTGPTAYREHFAASAPAGVLLAWTGPDIVVGSITRDDIDRAAASYQRRLVLWDNFPVNDFDPGRLFLGPLTGRTAEVAGSALAGVLANPMVWAAPSRFALASVAEWAADPRGYQSGPSAARALAVVAGSGAADLAPLVRASSAWPPSADQDVELSGMAEATLAGEPGGSTRLTARLEELARGCRAAAQPEPLVSALRPWLAAGAEMAEAGLAAVRLLDAAAPPTAASPAAASAPSPAAPLPAVASPAAPSPAVASPAAPSPAAASLGAVGSPNLHAVGSPDRVGALRDAARRALDMAEGRYANVLRSVIPPFVREALDRTAEPATAEPGAGGRGGKPLALLVTGSRRTAGDEAITALLDQFGFVVHRRAVPGTDDIEWARLVVVTRNAGTAAILAVARVQVPLVAWHGFDPLGLAHGQTLLLARERLCIVEPADPVAAGLHGVVSVHRGPAAVTVAEVGPDARVVARVIDDDRPAVFHYPAGTRLCDGTTAPAHRTGLFLGPDGLAPWLLTEAGRAIVRAGLRQHLTAVP